MKYTIEYRATTPDNRRPWRAVEFRTAAEADKALSAIRRRGDLEIKPGCIVCRYREGRKTRGFIQINNASDLWFCAGTPSASGIAWTGKRTISEAEEVARDYIPLLDLKAALA